MSRKKSGALTPLDSLKRRPNLVIRAAKDGTVSIAFKPRNAPKGSLNYVSLGKGVQPGDAERLSRIAGDAARLQAELERDRDAERSRRMGGTYPSRSLPNLAEVWRQHDAWRALKPRSQRSYEEKLSYILDWSRANGHPQVSTLTAKKIREFLKLWDDRQTQRQHIRVTISMMLNIAVEEGWIDRNPAKDVILRRTQPKRPVRLWSAEDVQLYSDMAQKIGWSSGPILYRAIWETGADPSDVMSWTDGVVREDPPAIDFDRGKTGIPTRIPISHALLRMVQGQGAGGLLRDANGVPLVGMESDARLAWLHRKTARAVVVAGGKALGLKHLRHSAATDAVQRGASLEDVSKLLAHADATMSREIYVQETAERLTQLQKKRGIIE